MRDSLEVKRLKQKSNKPKVKNTALPTDNKVASKRLSMKSFCAWDGETLGLIFSAHQAQSRTLLGNPKAINSR